MDTEAALAKLLDFIKDRGSQVHNLHSANTEHTLKSQGMCEMPGSQAKSRAGAICSSLPELSWGGVAGARLEHGMGSECPQPVPRVLGGGGEDCGS